MKRLVVAGALALGLLAASPTSAGAFTTWCDWDPIVVIVTPAGHVVPLFESVWTESPIDLAVPLASYTVTRAYDSHGRPVSVVRMTITVPTGLVFRYSTTDLVTTGPLGSGQVLAQASGASGTAVHLKFILPVP
jgi:hypothetical protein